MYRYQIRIDLVKLLGNLQAVNKSCRAIECRTHVGSYLYAVNVRLRHESQLCVLHAEEQLTCKSPGLEEINGR